MKKKFQKQILACILASVLLTLGSTYFVYKNITKPKSNIIGQKYQKVEPKDKKTKSNIHKVQNGIIVGDIGLNTEEKKVWYIVTKNLPQKYIDQIKVVEVSYLEEDMTLANIEKLDFGSNQNIFKIKINIEKLKTLSALNEIDETRVLPIFIHELGHQISLQSDQLEPNTNTNINQSLDKNEYVKDFNHKQSQCKITYYLKEGCSKPESYINQFYQKFWSVNWSDYQNIQTIQDENEFNQKSLEFYENHKDEFVSKEAFFSPEEDFAESFRVFVLGDKSKFSGITKEKVEFFEGFGEMVSIKGRIKS